MQESADAARAALESRGFRVGRSLVGNYVTSLDMAGCSITVTALGDDAVKARLRQMTDEAVAAGVFGSPFVIADGEPFWGNDRLDQVDEWLARGGW